MTLIVKPYSEKHAIRNVVFAFEFTNPLSTIALREIRASKLHSRLIEDLDLPQHSEQTAVTVNIGAHGAVPSFGSGTPELTGLTYAHSKPNGEAAWAVSIQSNALVVTCGDYQRWDGTWKKVSLFLAETLPSILSNTQINVIALQYLDEFSLHGSREDWDLKALFSKDSKYIPRNLTDIKGACHSHHGYFDFPESPDSYKRLTNINIGVTESGDALIAQIYSVHKCLLSSPLVGSVEELIGESGFIRKSFADLHKENKNIVGDLLNQEVKDKINFDGSK